MAMDESALAARFADLTRTLLDATTVAGALERIVLATCELVPGADLVSVTLRGDDGSFHTPVETEPAATELDQLQYKFGEGPCLDAARAPGPAVGQSDDLAASATWPRFGPAAAERGYHSALATALIPDAKPPRLSGALNIFSSRKAAFTQSDANIALLLATHASLVLAHTRALELAGLQAEHLRKALDSRDVIGQAKGILMHRRGVDAEKAFDILRAASQELNVKLAELAKTLATRHLDLDL
ncbi:GAF and ANTAR domain-containing protein [Amycolatopsis sp. NPDC059657]|uniref:GAF and ANTAR domain-containing protein n=1 Tax=Amycolatopsis sp. NPDC059657 TaxID=3346899 RepID=UPI00366BBEAC